MRIVSILSPKWSKRENFIRTVTFFQKFNLCFFFFFFRKPKNSVLLRLILGSSVTRITPDFLNRITYLHKIISSSDILSYHETKTGKFLLY